MSKFLGLFKITAHVAETTSEPVAETTSEPVAETTSEPVAETTSEPIINEKYSNK